MDYETLIDAETWDFIADTEAYYPPDTVDQDVTTQRRIYDTMCRAFFRGYPEGVTARDERIGTVPIRTYTAAAAARATVVYFHGGGFVVGGLDSHDDVCAEICHRTRHRVVSVDYRLAPEHKHPAMFDDALFGAEHVLKQYSGPVLLCGDSAGGNLAAAVAHRLRTEPRIAGQVLIYPGLGGDMNAGSYLRHAEAPMLRRDELEFYRHVRLSGDEPVGDPTYAPLHDTDFTDLPATLIITAECDPLSDDGRAYRDAIRRAGGRADWINEPGLVHGYLRARSTVARARASFDRIVAALADMGNAG